jgi:hypothetical protein
MKSWIRIHIIIKSWIRICIEIKIQKLQRLKIEPRTLTSEGLEAQNGALAGL